MSLGIEIILSVQRSDGRLVATVASLLAQTARNFSVVVGEPFAGGGAALDDAERRLVGGGIAVRRVRPRFELAPVEHSNWTHAQAQAEWLKPMKTGDELKPACIERLQTCLAQRPHAHLIRFASEMAPVPFKQESVTPVEFLKHFPPRGNWLGDISHFAYRRAAWFALGGAAVHLPECADAHLCVMLALHHGFENVAEPLVQPAASGRCGSRLSRAVEWWLLLRQARIFCHNGKLPWPRRGVLRGVMRQMLLGSEARPNRG